MSTHSMQEASSAQRLKEASRTGLSEVKEDLSAVGEDLARLKSDAAGAATTVAKSTAELARHGADAATEYVKRAGDQAKDTYESARAFVVHRPVASVLIAVGVGAVLGRVFMRR